MSRWNTFLAERIHVVGGRRRTKRRIALLSLATLLVGTGLVGIGGIAQATSVFTSYTNNTIADPDGITVGSDGALWFTNTSNPSIGRIDTSGNISNYPLPGIPGAITTGSDGALWFSLYENPGGNHPEDFIARMTMTGDLTVESSVPSPCNAAYSITSGPDGALWYLSDAADQVMVCRLTTSLGVSSFTDPALVGVNAGQITTGPDGALWFTVPPIAGETNGNLIGRITTDGSFTFYSDPSINEPEGITSGPDGALWFCNYGNTEGNAFHPSIGRITTDGTVTSYTNPSLSPALSTPFDIASGPDGALWFTDIGRGTDIGRITTSGQISWRNDPNNMAANPNFLVEGPDQAMWYTADQDPSAIGRVTTDVTPLAPSITNANSVSGVEGSVLNFTVTTVGYPTPSIAETGALPEGVTFADNGDGSGTLSGTPSAGTAGTYSVMFTASNGIGSPATQNFTLTVMSAPAITSAPSATFPEGGAGTFTVTTTGSPVPSLSETGNLPAGVTFTDNGDGTATLTGTPQAKTVGSYPLTIEADNGMESPAQQAFTLTVSGLQITTTSLPAGTRGSAYSYQLRATGGNAPLKWKKTVLPKGLKLSKTGLLSGTPSAKKLSAGPHSVGVQVQDSTKGVKQTATATLSLQLS